MSNIQCEEGFDSHPKFVARGSTADLREDPIADTVVGPFKINLAYNEPIHTRAGECNYSFIGGIVGKNLLTWSENPDTQRTKSKCLKK